MRRFAFIIALVLSTLACISTEFPSPAHAFGPTCDYSNVIYNYPNQVSPGEQFMVSISLPAVCPQTNNYHLTARFDIENSAGRVLASNYTQDGFVPNNGKPFTFIVTNNLTAPAQQGTWRLEFIVYAFMSEDDALGLDYEVKQPTTIQVEQPIQLQTGNNTVTATETESPTISMAAQASGSVAEAVASTSTNWEEYDVFAILVAILLLTTALLIVRRKQHSRS